MQSGRVIKGYSSFYYVETDGKIIECKLRGKLKLSYNSVLVGDQVKLNAKNNKGVIEDILPRRTELVRPAIANVDLVLIVFALTNPPPVIELLDRIILAAEAVGITPVLTFTKADLLQEQLELTRVYQKAGYEVFITSTASNLGINDVRQRIAGKISVVAGPSGAGKSSLLNALQPGLALKTGEISDKIGRGKHTTRHVELLPLPEGGYIADTPGFSVLYLPDIKPQELSELYPDFTPYMHMCKFSGCMHNTEPECGIKNALAEGKIDQARYERYLVFLEQLIQKERTQYD